MQIPLTCIRSRQYHPVGYKCENAGPTHRKVIPEDTGSSRWDTGQSTGPAELGLKEAPGVSPATLYMSPQSGITRSTDAGTIGGAVFTAPLFLWKTQARMTTRLN